MAETCIVCLGDLNSGASERAKSPEAPPINAAALQARDAVTDDLRPLHKVAEPGAELIAHLLPCAHNLHDECLKPWVERANSCPICRTSFNMVELREVLEGPMVSSYAVQDKQQVADVDPTMLIEDEIYEASLEACMICGSFGDEGQLLICDGCDNTCHTHCADLDEVPAGMFFCYDCQSDPRLMSNARNRATAHRRQPNRGRAGRGRPRTLAWERVWLAVRNQLDFDLEFPFSDEDVLEQQRLEAQRQQEQREINFFQRRFQVAERQGAASRFRDAAATMLREPPREAPKPESQDELRAWNAFEKARAIKESTSTESGTNRRKRKSATTSPSSPRPEPERQLKRPRTRRAQELAEGSSDPVAESSVAAQRSSSRRTSVPRRPRELPREVPREPPREVLREPAPEAGTSNFLQSLLKEVETSPPANSPGISDNFDNPGSGLERPSSPDGSPRGSNSPTPRAITPPPQTAPRPSSPTPLTINIMPIFPAAPEYSPPPHTPDEETHDRARSRRRKGLSSPVTSPTASRHASPTRNGLSYSTKSEIQRMVSLALKPRYLKQEVTKDEYTDINRDVSRLLYESIGDANDLAEQITRDKLQKTAEKEVEAAIKALRVTETDLADPVA